MASSAMEYVRHGHELANSKLEVGGWGQKAIQLGSHAGIGLFTKNVPNGFFGIEALKPDWIFVALAAAASAFLGKKSGKREAQSMFFGGLHAVVGRYVAQSTYFMHTSGEDGATPTFSQTPPKRQRQVVDATVSA